MVIGQRQVHDGTHNNSTVLHHGTVLDLVHAENGALRWIQNRRRQHGTEDTAVGNRKGATGNVIHGQLAISSLVCKLEYASLDFSEAHILGIAQDRYHQSTIGTDGHANVTETVIDNVVTIDGRINIRMALQCLGRGTYEE